MRILMPSVLCPVVLFACQSPDTGPCIGDPPFSPGWSFIHPASGSVDVPLNTRFWSWRINDGNEITTLSLAEPDGGVIPVTKTTLTQVHRPIPIVDVVTPAETLHPATQYRVFDGQVLALTFTTGTAEDHEAPPVPTEVNRETRITNNDSVLLLLPPPFRNESAAVTVETDSLGIILLSDIDDSSQFDENTISGVTSNVSVSTTAWLGENSCNTTWPGATRGSRAKVRFATFDPCGNFSGWGAYQDIVVSPFADWPTP